jgi:hypothetical protein
METKQLTHNYKVTLRLKGIAKRKRRIATIYKTLGYTKSLDSIEKEKFEDLATDYLEKEVREIHSDCYLHFLESKTTQYNNDPNDIMETTLPFSDLNQLINISSFK